MRRDTFWQPNQSRSLVDTEVEAYLAGGELVGDQRGWLVARWQQSPLGWLKGDGRRLKNHLPKPARVT